MSEIITLARPYAKAAFETAEQAGELAAWSAALADSAALAGEPELARLFDDPAITVAQLKQLVAIEASPQGFDNFVALLVENDRLGVLPQVAELFEQLKAEAEQALQVTVTSAAELEESYQQRLSEALSRRFEKKIELQCEIDQALLGGAVIRAGDVVIDGSLRGKLQRLDDQLTG